MKALDDKEQKNVSEILQKRVARCEAADLLYCKDFVDLQPEFIEKLLALTQDVWHLYPPFVTLKLAHRSGQALLAAVSGLGLGADGPDAAQTDPAAQAATQHDAVVEIGKAIALKPPCERKATFDVWNPTYAGVFHALLESLMEALHEAGSWEGDQQLCIKNDAENFGDFDFTANFSLDAEVKASSETAAKDITKETLKDIKSRAEDLDSKTPGFESLSLVSPSLPNPNPHVGHLGV